MAKASWETAQREGQDQLWTLLAAGPSAHATPVHSPSGLAGGPASPWNKPRLSLTLPQLGL